jgi:hypothetical protein
VLLIFDGGKSTKPTAAPHLPKLVIELHLRVEFKLFDKKEKTFYNPNTGDKINNIFSDKNKKNIFKSATLISNGAFLGLAAGVYLGII